MLIVCVCFIWHFWHSFFSNFFVKRSLHLCRKCIPNVWWSFDFFDGPMTNERTQLNRNKTNDAKWLSNSYNELILWWCWSCWRCCWGSFFSFIHFKFLTCHMALLSGVFFSYPKFHVVCPAIVYGVTGTISFVNCAVWMLEDIDCALVPCNLYRKVVKREGGGEIVVRGIAKHQTKTGHFS